MADIDEINETIRDDNNERVKPKGKTWEEREARHEARENEQRDYIRANDERIFAASERDIAARENMATAAQINANAVEELSQNQQHLFLTLNDALSLATSFAAEFLAAYQDRTKVMLEDAHLRDQRDQDYNRIIEEQG